LFVCYSPLLHIAFHVCARSVFCIVCLVVVVVVVVVVVAAVVVAVVVIVVVVVVVVVCVLFLLIHFRGRLEHSDYLYLYIYHRYGVVQEDRFYWLM